jgi:hypothetical protein
LNFVPVASGPAINTLTLSDQGPDSVGSYSIQLSGNGSTSPLSISPAIVAFGKLATGYTSATKTVTVKNISEGVVDLGAPALVSGASGFAITSTACGSTLAPFASCGVSLDFAPTAASGEASDTLTITDITDGIAPSVALSGTNTMPTTLIPVSVAFGNIASGTTSPARKPTLTNLTAGALTVSQSLSETGFAVSADSCSGTNLGPHTSCSVSVTYSPGTSNTVSSGTLTISDSVDAGYSVPLTGR